MVLMRHPIKGLLALTMMLMLFAASSQAAVCELSCALKMQSGACHTAADAPMADVAAMDMPASDCPAMRGASFESAAPQGSCNHPLEFAVEQAGSVDYAAFAPRWTLFEMWLVRPAPTVNERLAGKSPPFRLATIDPVFLSFRV